MIRVTTAAILFVTAAALAQPAITIEVDSPTLMPGQSTTVTMFAGYGGLDYAVAAVVTNLATSVGSEGWSDPIILEPMTIGGSVGTPSDTGFDGIIAGQIHSPLSFPADPRNPIAFWQATYTAPLDATAPFDIDLSTMTTRYDVYIDRARAASESRLADLTEGSATIRVIPAPASASLLALGLLAAARRRR